LKTLRLGTRKSQLALWQANFVRKRLLGRLDKARRSHPAFGPKRTYSVEYSRRLSKVGAAGRCTSSAIELVVCPDNTQVPSRRLFIEIEYMAAE